MTDEPYAYASGNPLTYVDLLGLWSWNPGNWTPDEWSTVVDVAMVTSLVVCIIATAGACGVVGAIVTVAAVGVAANNYRNSTICTSVAGYAKAVAPELAMALIPGGRVAKAGKKIAAASKAEAQVSEKTYQTYTKIHPDGTVYVGRTSGKKSGRDNVFKRDSKHHMTNKGYGLAQLDVSTSNLSAIRGREQQMIEKHGGAKSKGGTSGNAINGISDKNLKRQQYLDASTNEFGELK